MSAPDPKTSFLVPPDPALKRTLTAIKLPIFPGITRKITELSVSRLSVQKNSALCLHLIDLLIKTTLNRGLVVK